jgi:diacylglycerol kinase
MSKRDTTHDPILFSTMKINPDDYSYQTAKNQFESLQFATAGLLFLLRRQHTIRLLTVMTVGVVILTFVLKVSLQGIMLALIALGMVWITEIFNTAFVAVINLIQSDDYHPMAKVGKDVAAAASLVTSFIATIIILLILIPPLLDAF